MKRKLMCGLLLVVSALTGASYAAESTSQTNELAWLQAAFTSAVARIDEKYLTRQTNAPTQYLLGLDQLEKAYQQQGDFKSVIAVREERKLFSSDLSAPGPDIDGEPTELKSLKSRMRAVPTELGVQKKKESVALVAVYLGRLESLQRDVTKQGRIALAAEVQAEIDRVKPLPDALPPPGTVNTSGIQPNEQSPNPVRSTRTAHSVTAATRAVPAVVYITCDDSYTAWLNGEPIGRGRDWRHLDRYEINIRQHDVLSILATDDNGGRAAGLFCCIVLPTLGRSLGTSRKWLCAIKEPAADWRTTDSLVGFRGMSEEYVSQGLSAQAEIFRDQAAVTKTAYVWSQQPAGSIWVKKVIDFGEFEAGSATASVLRQPVAPRSRSSALQDRRALLEEAKKTLEPEQYAIAEKMTFSKFRFKAAMSGSYCEIDFATTASVEDIQNRDLKARVRYLCKNADKRMLVLEGQAKMKPNVKAGAVDAGSGMMTGYVKENNNGIEIPLNAHITILLYDVPIYEGLWKGTGVYSEYAADGKTPWWQDEGLVKSRK